MIEVGSSVVERETLLLWRGLTVKMNSGHQDLFIE